MPRTDFATSVQISSHAASHFPSPGRVRAGAGGDRSRAGRRAHAIFAISAIAESRRLVLNCLILVAPCGRAEDDRVGFRGCIR